MNLKKNLQVAMTDIATEYRALLGREMRGPSDSDGAMHRLQSKFGLDYWQQWALRYRPTKKIAADFVARIHAAYMATLEQSVKRDLQILKIERAKDAARTDLACLLPEAESLLAEIAKARAVK